MKGQDAKIVGRTPFGMGAKVTLCRAKPKLRPHNARSALIYFVF